MKDTVKIVLIVLTAAIIIGLLYYFTDKIEIAGAVKIVPKPFVEYVEQRVDQEVQDKPFDEAKVSFYELVDEINTESFVWLNDSTKALTPADSVKCLKLVFYAYAPIFASYGSAYFERSIWTKEMTNALRDEADALLAYQIAEGGSLVKNDLGQIVKNVKDYNDALNVIKNASFCESVDAVNASIANAKKYKHAPLSNNTMLQKDLNSVPNIAKEALANKLVARSTYLINNKYNQGSYQNWFELYDNLIIDIEKYENAFGSITKLTNEKERLQYADGDALDYYD